MDNIVIEFLISRLGVLRSDDQIVGPVEQVEQAEHQGEQPGSAAIKICLKLCQLNLKRRGDSTRKNFLTSN